MKNKKELTDKRLTGQWYKEDMGETVNIFDETPIRMKMSFTSSGFYNFEPNCVYEKDGYLCYEINDEKYRMVYRVRYEDGFLVGSYTQFGIETPVKYVRVSDIPEDGKSRYTPPEIYVPGTDEKRIDILKRYSKYDRSKTDIPYTTEYVLGGTIPEILEKYRYSDYIKGLESSDDRLVFALLDFVCDNFGHNGASDMPSERTIEHIIEYCEQLKSQINCRGLAILLASLLRLNNIKARHITCMPYEDPFSDCHVVVDCLLPSGKRVMLDPTWRLYLKDKNGDYVSLEHLRQMLIDGEPIFANETASHNGEPFDSEYHRNYMTKNTLRFSRGIYFADGCDDRTKRRVELIPTDYPTDNFGEAAKEEFVYNEEEFWKM